MIKKLSSCDDLFVGWHAWIDGSCWIYLGKTHKHFFGSQLRRFLVVRPDSDARTEFLSDQGVSDYVLSKVC